MGLSGTIHALESLPKRPCFVRSQTGLPASPLETYGFFVRQIASSEAACSYKGFASFMRPSGFSCYNHCFDLVVG
jgi:hypothetical protein